MGKRLRYRPRQGWYDTVEKDLTKINALLNMEAALDRKLEEHIRSDNCLKWIF